MATRDIALTSTIFAAGTGSIGAVNIVSDWVAKLVSVMEKYGEARDRIQVILSDVEACATRLELWQKKWKMSEETTFSWLIELWGEDQARSIWKKVTKIQARCNRLEREFRNFCHPELSEYINDAITKGHFISADRSVAAYESTSNTLSSRTIMDFIGRLDSLATNWLAEVEKWLIDLSETADKAFCDEHDEKVSGKLTEAQIRLIRTSVLMRMALELRNTSEELYRSCLNAATASHEGTGRTIDPSTKLKIDLTGARGCFRMDSVESQRTIQLIYHFLLQWNVLPSELCIEGPVGGEVEGAVNFFSAYTASQAQGNSIIVVNDQPEAKFFRSRLPDDRERLSFSNGSAIRAAVSLANFLHALNDLGYDAAMRIFPLSERIALAFKIVESAILLAGTSWLSNISSLSLHRHPLGQAENHNYTVALKGPAHVQWKTLARLKCHIFRIGVLLVEIGYGKQVVDIEYDYMGILQFLFHGDETYVPFGGVKEVVITHIDSEYASTMHYCLEDVQDQCDVGDILTGEAINDKYKDVLEQYFGKVYTPMGKKASRYQSRRDTVASLYGPT